MDGTVRWFGGDGFDAGVARDPTPAFELCSQRWGNEVEPFLVEALIPSVADDPRWRRVLGRMQRRAGTPRAAYGYWQNAVVKVVLCRGTTFALRSLSCGSVRCTPRFRERSNREPALATSRCRRQDQLTREVRLHRRWDSLTPWDLRPVSGFVPEGDVPREQITIKRAC